MWPFSKNVWSSRLGFFVSLRGVGALQPNFARVEDPVVMMPERNLANGVNEAWAAKTRKISNYGTQCRISCPR